MDTLNTPTVQTPVDAEKLFQMFAEDPTLTPDKVTSSDSTAVVTTNPESVTTSAPVTTDQSQKPPEVSPAQSVVTEQSSEVADKQEAVETKATPPSSKEEQQNVQQQQQQSLEDWVSKVPEEFRAKALEAAQLAQRAAHFQEQHADIARRLRRQNNELMALRQQQQQTQTKQPTAQQQQSEADPDLEALRQADPKLAEFLEKREAKLRAELQKTSQETAKQFVDPLVQEREENFVREQLSILDAKVSNWREVHSTEHFHDWLQRATPGVQQLYGSRYAEDSVRLLAIYNAEMSALYPSQPSTTAVPTQPATPAPITEKPAVVQQREERLQKSVPVQPATPIQTEVKKLSPEELLQQFFEKPESIHTFLKRT